MSCRKAAVKILLKLQLFITVLTNSNAIPHDRSNKKHPAPTVFKTLRITIKKCPPRAFKKLIIPTSNFIVILCIFPVSFYDCISSTPPNRHKKIVYFSPVIPGVCFSDAVTKARFSPEFHVFLSS